MLAENRLFLPLDLAHSWDAVKIAVYGLEPAGKFTRIGEITVAGHLKIDVVTDYEVANEITYWKGRFFTKTRTGPACIDLRKP